jgi:asparagine synthase (glutamine-hydrolysing)
VSGIAGVIELKGSKKDKQKINILLDKISHRGDKREILGISGGYIGINTSYDFETRVGQDIVLMDGRIYNLDHLMTEYNIGENNSLISDSEKICLLLNKAGKNIFRDFKGSFALVIVDKEENIYLVRDFIGTKPLYYYKDGKTLMFASEVKSLIGFTSDIKEFPPGSYMVNLSEPKVIKKVDTDNYTIINDQDSGALEDKLEKYLLKSMDTRIADDNSKLGVWLSGGIDSSIVAALLKEFTDKVYTYSVGHEGSPDLEAAKVVSDYLGTIHTECMLDTEELFTNIPKAIYHLESFDAPLVRSTLGNMIVSKISAPSDIVFSGEGGDELFAGYNYFLEYDSSRVIQKECVNAINSLHNTALQRVDRTSNAYGVNIKLPMLDENLLNYVLKIPPKNKVRKDKNTGKYILRKVAAKYLPDDIAWRSKEKFWEGAGIEDTLEKKINTIITDKEFSDNIESSDGPTLRNKEEAYYYRVFKDYYPDVNIEDILSFTQDFN